MRLTIIILFAFIFLFSCNNESLKDKGSLGPSVLGKEAAIVSPHPISTAIGLEILRQGGNAVEASIAVQYAMAVVYPRAGNIGGGGFAVISNNGNNRALDYREKAPLASTRDMYLDRNGDVIKGLSTEGGLAVGVPGTVDGMFQLLEQYGSALSMKELIAPSIELARKGFAISKSEADRLNKFKEKFVKNNPFDFPFVKLNEWKAGDTLKQEKLAVTLEKIADNGKDGFYSGDVANHIKSASSRSGGILTLDDLKSYASAWREPTIARFGECEIISMPPSSSGGIVLSQILTMLEELGYSKFNSPNQIEYIHTLVELEKRAYADRAEYMGDSDFYPVPISELLDTTYLSRKLENFSMEQATVADSIYNDANFQLKESYETTHTSCLDKNGMAVSITTTLNSNYGSKVYVQDAGFFLNNEMDDFSTKPGVPNQFGLVGGEANAIQASKRMLSSMTPTIVVKDNRPFLILGSPGGSTIITSVLQVFLNVELFNMSLEDAVNAKRFHHQWLPDRIIVEEERFDSIVINDLNAKGHHCNEVKSIGKVKAILYENGKIYAVGDPRNLDDTAGAY